MTLNVRWECDICGDNFKWDEARSKIFPVIFSGTKKFAVEALSPETRQHEGKHICKSCLNQMGEILSKGREDE